MDTVTHVIAGVVLSEATFRRRIGRSANWLAALAAFTPDLDVVANWIDPDPWVGIEVHRGLSHALVMAPVFALVWAGLWWAVRRRQFLACWALASLAMLTHPFLDLVTTYGTQVFWPFTRERYALDLLPLIDVFFSPILIVALVSCWASRRFRRPGVAPWLAGVGLVLASGYLGLAGWVDYSAKQFARQTVPDDHGPVLRVRAAPMMGATFARRLAVKTPEGYYVARYNWLAPPQTPRWNWAPSDADRYVEAADALPRIGTFHWFAMGMARPVVEQAVHDNGDSLVRVTYYDMRYGYPADAVNSIFAAWVILDARTGGALEGPVRSRWAGDETPEGLAAFFDPPADKAERVSRRLRIRDMWREAWKE